MGQKDPIGNIAAEEIKNGPNAAGTPIYVEVQRPNDRFMPKTLTRVFTGTTKAVTGVVTGAAGAVTGVVTGAVTGVVTVDLDHYFSGPQDTHKHSKWPPFLRMEGSILPQMIMSILLATTWATVITCISKLVKDLGVSSILLTILGFVVALALSFRSSTGYERYMEGRRYWALLNLTCRNLARYYWIHVPLREGEHKKQDLLKKLTAINLILGFAVSLKHKLRFEPYTYYNDLQGLIEYLDTFARSAWDSNLHVSEKPSSWKSAGSYLGLPFAEDDPMKLIKTAPKPLGNLPLEILTHLSAYTQELIADGCITSVPLVGLLHGAVATMTEVLTGTERIVYTPLPAAYKILFSQITWIYILVLPFQLLPTLGWITIPATVFAAYIIIGISAIGVEVENPFGNDVNDLPMDNFCRDLAIDLAVLTAGPPPVPSSFMVHDDNPVLFPLSQGGYNSWNAKSMDEIYAALKVKSIMSVEKKIE